MHSRKTCLVAVLAAAGGFLLGRTFDEIPAAPETAEILFENDRVRVLEYRTNAGTHVCGLGLHSHPDHLYIMKTAGRLRLTSPDGKTEEVDAKAGEVGWEAAGTHGVECISGDKVEAYLIEIKDRNWKPSTGLKP